MSHDPINSPFRQLVGVDLSRRAELGVSQPMLAARFCSDLQIFSKHVEMGGVDVSCQ